MSGVEVIAEVGSIEARGFCSSPLCGSLAMLAAMRRGLAL
jgi:hypothetical protein